MTDPIHVTDAEFEAKVLKSALPVVVDFWATWCVPCRAIAPTLERIAMEFSDRLIVVKVDVDENPVYAQQYGVQGIPTLLLVHQGKIVNRIVGALPEARLKASVKDFLDQIEAPGPGLASPGAS